MNIFKQHGYHLTEPYDEKLSEYVKENGNDYFKNHLDYNDLHTHIHDFLFSFFKRTKGEPEWYLKGGGQVCEEVYNELVESFKEEIIKKLNSTLRDYITTHEEEIKKARLEFESLLKPNEDHDCRTPMGDGCQGCKECNV